MARLGKKLRAVIALLALWLLLCGTPTPFFSERHQPLPRRPASSEDVISSRYYFSLATEHINSTLSRADVTNWMNPIQIVTAVISGACLLAVMLMVLYLLVLLGFCGCHLAVHWAISDRHLPSSRLYFEAKNLRLAYYIAHSYSDV